MVSLRIVLNSFDDEKFLAFSMNEAFELIREYNSDNIRSIHIYPNYNSHEK